MSRAVSKYYWHQLGLQLPRWDAFLSLYDEDAQLRLASTWGDVALAYEASILDTICNRSWLGNLAGYPAILAMTSVLGSEVCERLLACHEEAMLAIAITPESAMRSYRFIVRTRSCGGLAGAEDDVGGPLECASEPAPGHPNVGLLAKAFGGGGHACAAGFQLRSDDIKVKEIFRALPTAPLIVTLATPMPMPVYSPSAQ